MSGCDGYSPTAQNDAENSTQTPVSTPVAEPGSNGLPLSDGISPFIARAEEYWLDEDTVLSGELSVTMQAAGTEQSLETDLSLDRPSVAATDLRAAAAVSQENITYQLLRQPTHGSLELDTDGSFNYAPATNFFGDDSFTFYAWQDQLGSSPATVKLHVRPQPDTPEIVASVVPVVEQGADYQVEFLASDADGDELSFQATNIPSWLEFDITNGALSGLPAQEDVGIHTDISVAVTDSSGLRAVFGPFSIEVIDINDSPTINPSQFPTRMDARETVTVFVFPDDPDGDMVSVSAELNDFVDVKVQGGSLEIIAKDVVEVTDINLVVIAEDRLGSVSREVLPIRIYPVTESGKGRTLFGRRYGDGVHLVVLGDGYKQDELAQYEQHATELIALMRNDPAVDRHFAAWNVHIIPTPSTDSGIDDNVLEDYRQTEFNAGFFCGGIPRLICADDLHIFTTALEEYPHLDQIVLLVNDPRYGGSGGAVAVASISALEVALHELGHSVAHLADEYADSTLDPTTYGEFAEGEFANVSYRNSAGGVPWAHWITDKNNYPTQLGQAGVGIFEGAYYQSSDVYRPTSDSRMRTNESHFGPVNGEQWALSVYRIAHPVRDFGPSTRTVQSAAGNELPFFVVPLFDSSLQSVTWELDGEVVTTGTDPNTLEILPTAGKHQLEVRVEDVSGMIRKPPPHDGLFKWSWEITVR
ncbi:MAG: hypothetical protein KTR32_25960 [Granulosicoccus sp.]|nr:hypothetical protein [Granulosicoccus sp.]